MSQYLAFKEELISQIPALQLLKAMGYRYLTPAEALAHRGGKLSNVILEDILEELVGEINDEYDRLPTHVLPSGKAWVVGGGISLSRLREETGIELAEATRPPSEVKTLNDWFNVHLGRKVRGGEIVDYNGVRIIIRKMRRQKVMEAQISHISKAALTP